MPASETARYSLAPKTHDPKWPPPQVRWEVADSSDFEDNPTEPRWVWRWPRNGFCLPDPEPEGVEAWEEGRVLPWLVEE